MTARLAVVDPSGHGHRELFTTSRDVDLAAHLKSLARGQRLTGVAVATGPGSFTGLRVGASFGLGLAKGLGIPLYPLPTLDLHAVRSDSPATAVVEAGRGRVYYRLPGGEPALGEPAEVPTTHPLVGNVSLQTELALIGAGHHFRPEQELRSFSEAAALLLKTAREVPYSSLKLEYMQSFSASK
ncbi:MAG: tRNA (adenosine(37)-N6)-threonylcarbamoyltransferase complex dimerization subunit type 1 TsaB [Candidatus Dormiibacterota bacterium]